uniref:Pre-mRNA-splicing factor SLU7 n=1 Tax=Ditylenchus dipsaci TaxID=166011 RepID=A0A915CV58_9BILA
MQTEWHLCKALIWIREDTAKYLCNLDANSAYYDPKSRSMRDNPFKDMPGKEFEEAKFAGENFIRYSGEVVKANEAQVFAWQATSKGVDLHALGEPTKLENLKKVYENEKNVIRGSINRIFLRSMVPAPSKQSQPLECEGPG